MNNKSSAFINLI